MDKKELETEVQADDCIEALVIIRNTWPLLTAHTPLTAGDRVQIKLVPSSHQRELEHGVIIAAPLIKETLPLILVHHCPATD